MTPYYQTPDGKVTLHHGHVLDVLREMPAESVNCCVTSPPYWSLRKYDCEPVIWGGDPNCPHTLKAQPVGGESYEGKARWQHDGVSRQETPEAWVKTPGRTYEPGQGMEELAKVWKTGGKPKAGVTELAYGSDGTSATCSLCGAWRGQYGLEPTPELYVEHTVAWLREVKRVLRKDGTCWVNCGDGYWGGKGQSGAPEPKEDAARYASGESLQRGEYTLGVDKATRPSDGRHPVLKPKDAVLMPFRVALAAQAEGFWVRSVIIWAKPNPMPESVRDRPTDAHEYIFLLTKSKTYWYDADAVREVSSGLTGGRFGTYPEDTLRHDSERPRPEDNGGRNCRSVWTFPTEPFSEWTRTVRQVRVERDEVVDGTKRIASPDCPVHGDQDRRETRASCGEHEDGRCDGKQRTDSHPVQAQLDDCAPIDQPLGVDSQAGSSGLPRPECVPAATVRSSGSRRMGHVPATTPSCTPSEETAGRIEHTSVEPAMNAEHCPDTDGCNTSPDGKAARLPDQTQVHTVHKSSLPIPPDCSCSFYNEIAEQTSHFAVFPRELPERCMKAGCPEWVCPKCGKARVRVVEHQPAARNTNSPKDASRVALGMMSEKNRLCGPGWRKQAPEINETLGWTDCGCGAGFVGGVTLDPFVGSGTTCEVAYHLGRTAWGIDASAKYLDMAIERVKQGALL